MTVAASEIPPDSSPSESHTELENSSNDAKDQEISQLRAQLTKAQARLATLSEGMRLVAAQMRQADMTAPKQCHSSNKNSTEDDQTIATQCETVVSDADTTFSTHLNNTALRLAQLLPQLSASQTADLLALQNAAAMLQEHAQWAAQEASWAVRDAVAAQQAAIKWQKKSEQRKEMSAQLRAQNTELRQRNDKLAQERRVLIREVRKLRQAQIGQQNYFTQFQAYVVEATSLHERRLRKLADTPYNSAKENDEDDLSVHSVASQIGFAVDLPHIQSLPSKEDYDDDDDAFVALPAVSNPNESLLLHEEESVDPCSTPQRSREMPSDVVQAETTPALSPLTVSSPLPSPLQPRRLDKESLEAPSQPNLSSC